MRGWVVRAELAALVLVALWALWFQLRLPSRLPTEDEDRQVSQVLAAEARPGDVLLLQPWWTERARLFAPRSLPVVGYQGSVADPLTDSQRIWVLSQPDLPRGIDPGFEEKFLPQRTRIGDERTFGHLHLSLYQNGRYRPSLFAGIDSIAKAHVYVEQPNGSRVACPWDGTAHRCPLRDLHVGAEWHAIDFVPLHCLWLHPPGGDAQLVVEFPDTPHGETLELRGGMIWDRGYFHGDDYSSTGLVALGGNGQRLASMEFPTGLISLQRAQGPAPGGLLTLKVHAQLEHDRDLCADVRVLGGAQ